MGGTYRKIWFYRFFYLFVFGLCVCGVPFCFLSTFLGGGGKIPGERERKEGREKHRGRKERKKEIRE